jgi:hypothetical protein
MYLLDNGGVALYDCIECLVARSAHHMQSVHSLRVTYLHIASAKLVVFPILVEGDLSQLLSKLDYE